jgi:phage terminase large subunit
MHHALQVPSAFRELFTPARYKAYYGGRGSAKSHSFAAALIIRATRDTTRVLCTREIQSSIRDSVKRVLDDKIDAAGLRPHFYSTDAEIRARHNDSRFTFAGLRSHPDSVKSMEGIDIAYVEEANTVSARSIELLIPTVRKPGSEVWFGWNPRSPDDPVDAMFRGNDRRTQDAGRGFEPPPRSIIRRVNWDSNPWFPDVLREEMQWAQARDPDKYGHIWLGGYQRSSEARVFKNWRVERFETPPDARFYFGADWGFSVDPTVLVRCYIVGKTLYIDREAYKVGCSIDATPALFDTVPGSRAWPATGDSARPETIDYMQRHGFPRLVGALKGINSVMDGIEFLKNYDIVVHPDHCPHTIDELTLYSFKVDEHTKEVLPILEDKKNHVIDALRYAVEGVRRAGTFTVSEMLM